MLSIIGHEKRLTDGSLVYDIELRQGDESITLNLVPRRDCRAVMDKLTELIELHTNESLMSQFLPASRVGA